MWDFLRDVLPIVSIGSLVIAFLMYRTQRENAKNSHLELTEMKTNHYAHLESDVKYLKEQDTNFRNNITDLYNKVDELSKVVYKMEGKLNGK